MSLKIQAYARTEDGQQRALDERPREPRNTLAGPESWRHTIYGARVSRALGLKLLPTLTTGDIHAENGELELLEREVHVLLANTARWPQINLDSLRARLLNILEAIRLARTVPRGGVYLG